MRFACCTSTICVKMATNVPENISTQVTKHSTMPSTRLKGEIKIQTHRNLLRTPTLQLRTLLQKSCNPNWWEWISLVYTVVQKTKLDRWKGEQPVSSTIIIWQIIRQLFFFSMLYWFKLTPIARRPFSSKKTLPSLELGKTYTFSVSALNSRNCTYLNHDIFRKNKDNFSN